MSPDSTAVTTALGSDFNYARSLAQLVLVLAVMGGASFLGLRWLRNRGRVPGLKNAASIEILGQRRISAHGVLHMVRWNGRTLLIGSTDQSITVLDRQEDDDESRA